MVNVNCTQENPPKNRIVLIKGVPLKSAIHNLIPRHDVHSCAIPIPIQIVLHWVAPPADDCFPSAIEYFFRFYREVSILTTSSLQQKIRIQDSIEISILLN